jgi:hypothetical protein
MGARTRKLIGTIALLLFLIVYVALAAAIAAGRNAEAAPRAKLAYSLVAGLAWIVPAGLIIRWMQRPDPQNLTRR